MSFNPMPKDWEQRKYDELTHAQTMLNIIGALGAYNKTPSSKYDYGQQTDAINQQMSSAFLNSVLNANSDRVAPRNSAVGRRYVR
jgi:hypothetical protein